MYIPVAATKAVNQWFDSQDETALFLDPAKLLPALAELGWSVVLALAQSIESRSGVQRIIAAASALKLNDLAPGEALSDSQVRSAWSVLRNALARGDLAAIAAFAYVIPPDLESVRAICRFTESDDAATHLNAWVSLAHFYAERQEMEWHGLGPDISSTMALEVLQRYVHDTRIGMGLWAVWGLAYMGEVDGGAERCVIRALAGEEGAACRRLAIYVAAKCGRRSVRIRSVIRSAAQETSKCEEDAFAIGYALGRTTPADEIDSLPTLLRDSEFSGFLFGFASAGASVREVRDKLLDYLSDSEKEARLAAATIIGLDRRLANELLPELLTRAHVEMDVDVTMVLSETVARAGGEVVPRVVDMLTSKHRGDIMFAAMVASELGSAGLRAAVQAYERTSSPFAQGAVVALFRDVKADDPDVILEMGRLLSACVDPEMRYLILAGMRGCGPKACICVRDVLGLIADQNTDVRLAAEAVLQAMGPSAVPAIREHMSSVSDEEAQRLELLCGWLEEHDHDMWRRFGMLEERELVALLCAGEMCVRVGGSMSLREMTDTLKHAGIVADAAKDHSFIERAMNKAEQLVTAGRKIRSVKKRRTALTNYGRIVLVQLRRYLVARGVDLSGLDT